MRLTLVSIGHLAGAVQASLPRVLDALERLRIQPEVRIDDVDHYPADAVDQVIAELKRPVRHSEPLVTHHPIRK